MCRFLFGAYGRGLGARTCLFWPFGASLAQVGAKLDGFGALVRAACLQNETAPKIFNFKTKNGPKNDPKLPRITFKPCSVV